jgi:3-mercaptopyruvate sulfurtransferase SseA
MRLQAIVTMSNQLDHARMDGHGALVSTASLSRHLADTGRHRLAPLIESSDPIIVYCGGGVTAAGSALALTVVGARNVAVYAWDRPTTRREQ